MRACELNQRSSQGAKLRTVVSKNLNRRRKRRLGKRNKNPDISSQLWRAPATIASGTITTANAPYAIVGPSTFTFQQPNPVGAVGQARWIGDINQDGLDDVCWASPFDNAGDGSFEVLWDAR